MVLLGVRCKFSQPVHLKIIKCSSCLISFVTNSLESTSSRKNHHSVISLHFKYSMEMLHKHFYFCTIMNKSTISVEQRTYTIVRISLVQNRLQILFFNWTQSCHPQSSVIFSFPYQFFTFQTFCYIFFAIYFSFLSQFAIFFSFNRSESLCSSNLSATYRSMPSASDSQDTVQSRENKNKL